MGKNKSDYSILAVDDSEIMMSLIKILLENEGYKFSSADCATLAIELIKNQHYDLGWLFFDYILTLYLEIIVYNLIHS